MKLNGGLLSKLWYLVHCRLHQEVLIVVGLCLVELEPKQLFAIVTACN